MYLLSIIYTPGVWQCLQNAFWLENSLQIWFKISYQFVRTLHPQIEKKSRFHFIIKKKLCALISIFLSIMKVKLRAIVLYIYMIYVNFSNFQMSVPDLFPYIMALSSKLQKNRFVKGATQWFYNVHKISRKTNISYFLLTFLTPHVCAHIRE